MLTIKRKELKKQVNRILSVRSPIKLVVYKVIFLNNCYAILRLLTPSNAIQMQLLGKPAKQVVTLLSWKEQNCSHMKNLRNALTTFQKPTSLEPGAMGRYHLHGILLLKLAFFMLFFLFFLRTEAIWIFQALGLTWATFNTITFRFEMLKLIYIVIIGSGEKTWNHVLRVFSYCYNHSLSLSPSLTLSLLLCSFYNPPFCNALLLLPLCKVTTLSFQGWTFPYPRTTL